MTLFIISMVDFDTLNLLNNNKYNSSWDFTDESYICKVSRNNVAKLKSVLNALKSFL